MLLTTIFFAAMVSGPVECRCGCVDGAPLTLCGSIAAAQRQPVLCPEAFRCPLSDGSITTEPLAAPAAETLRCRRTAVWDVAEDRYRPRQLCDVAVSRPD